MIGRLADKGGGLPFAVIGLSLSIALGGCSSGSAPRLNSVSAFASGTTASGAAGEGGLIVVSYLPAPPDTRDGADQLIYPDDVLDMDVFQVDDLDRTVQVDASGYITVPLVGTVLAAGKTARALGKELESAYGAQYLQSPDIIIFVKDSAGQKVTVDGEVARPGLYPVTAGSSILQILAQAGGFRAVADTTQVFLFRPYGDDRLVTSVDVRAIRGGKRDDPERWRCRI